ncbi:uncharacterized protein LOC135142314 [Zophobas morio]|uniref:uncharacterized protein LOC135142314 n=1 Tax=Zophobas morio TaxID=2755281 RepID=UPI0030827410
MAKNWNTKLRPENFVSDYLLSKINTEVLADRKFATPLINTELYLETWRKKFHTAEEYLKHQRKEYEQKRIEMDAKWNEIFLEGQTFQDNFLSFNEFIIANHDKRKRAVENIKYNNKIVKDREEGIRNFSASILELHQLKKEIDVEIYKHAIYKKYLASVLENSTDEGFINADSIVECYEHYVELALDIVKKQTNDFSILQNAKGELAKFEEINRNVILGLHTQVAGLHGRYEEAVRKTRHLEYLIGNIRRKALENFTDMMITKLAITNLYVQMCQKKNLKPTIAKHNFEGKLIFISRILKQYDNLFAKIQKSVKK